MASTFIVSATQARSNTADGALWHITWPNDILPMGLYTRRDSGDYTIGAAVDTVLPVIAWTLGITKLEMAVIDDHHCRIKVYE